MIPAPRRLTGYFTGGVMIGKPAAPPSAIETLKLTINKDIKRIKRKYVILKIKWFLLFVLPILLIVVAYQTAKQYLKLKIRAIGQKADNAVLPEGQSKITEQEKQRD